MSLALLCSVRVETQGGYYIFALMDWYSGSWSLILLAVLEVILVAWVSELKIFNSFGLQSIYIFRRNVHQCMHA